LLIYWNRSKKTFDGGREDCGGGANRRAVGIGVVGARIRLALTLLLALWVRARFYVP